MSTFFPVGSTEQRPQADRKRCFTSTESRDLARSVRDCVRTGFSLIPCIKTHARFATKLFPSSLHPRA